MKKTNRIPTVEITLSFLSHSLFSMLRIINKVHFEYFDA